ncbi:MAG: site-specific DNA-methyltransferase [Holophagales bacterium]|nr:MAG: site-specific DNA-methyltransferase [Holophagales bacterium]
MPTLEWIGKRAVVNHHREIPFRLLKCDPELSVGDPESGNLLIEGDNLHALKALLPYYAGKVKCIYIDPPYNTGNEGWVYNDNVNSPEIRKWLGEVVGREAEDLSRHDKWLCMMYPRLALLWEFLTQDGALFVSVDDCEVQHLRSILDEIFGKKNFVATVIWQKVYSPKNSARHFSEDHDYLVVYAKDAERWAPNLLPRSEEQDRRYRNLDGDARGPWKTSDLSARNPYSRGTYPITCPSGRVVDGPPRGMYWRVSREEFDRLDRDNRIWWGRNRDSIPQIKRFLSEVKQGVVPQTLWRYEEVGHTQEAKQELLAICDFDDSASVFVTPKPTRLIRRIINIAGGDTALILDSFAGTGTTGQAVMQSNKTDNGVRRFILVELDQAICRGVARQRLKNVVDGYSSRRLGTGEGIQGLGGGFRYCRLGEALFDEAGRINERVTFPDLAAHVFFSETGTPISRRDSGCTPLLGVHQGRAIYLLFNGILGDLRPVGGNVLTRDVLAALPEHDGPRVIYGESSRLSRDRLAREGIVFKQVPYEIRVG